MVNDMKSSIFLKPLLVSVSVFAVIANGSLHAGGSQAHWGYDDESGTAFTARPATSEVQPPLPPGENSSTATISVEKAGAFTAGRATPEVQAPLPLEGNSSTATISAEKAGAFTVSPATPEVQAPLPPSGVSSLSPTVPDLGRELVAPGDSRGRFSNLVEDLVEEEDSGTGNATPYRSQRDHDLATLVAGLVFYFFMPPEPAPYTDDDYPFTRSVVRSVAFNTYNIVASAVDVGSYVTNTARSLASSVLTSASSAFSRLGGWFTR